MESRGGKPPLTVTLTDDKGERTLEFEALLIAAGGKPTVNGLGLEAAGIEYDARLGVKVNDRLQTTNPDVYAVGDVVSKYQFTHMSDFGASLVIRNALFFGRDKFELDWKNAKWRFANAEHRDLFKFDPEKYAPQYGGYCAWAVSQGYTASVDPKNALRIVAGKLYLNYNVDIQKKWTKDIPGNIKKADTNWPGVLN